MDKNPGHVFENNLRDMLKEFSNKNPNMVLCSEPFLKSQFLNRLIDSVDVPVIFLDFDLLYSGYVLSNMISHNGRVELYRPENHNLRDIVSKVAKKITEEKCLVILDSLNGFHNQFTEMESGSFINAMIMLLVSVAKNKKSIIVVSAMAREKNENWVLSPSSRQVIESKTSGMYYVKNHGKLLVLRSFTHKDSQKIFRVDN